MKFLFVTTISNTINAFLIPHIEMLIQQGHQVDVAFKKVQDVNSTLLNLGCKVHEIPFERSPLNKGNLLALKKLKKVIIEGNYDIVHTHTPIASACSRFVCKNLNVKVIYTAHGFHFHKGAPLINWLIYYPLEKSLSKYTSSLITINKEDYEQANRKFSAKSTLYVPGIGLNLKKFQFNELDRLTKRKELQVTEDTVILLSIGELNSNKNHKVVINALAKSANKNFKYFICGIGPLERELKSLIADLKLENNVQLLGFRKDIAHLCSAADIFVFPSFREGLPVSVMEAMSCKLPVIASDIRGNQDLIENDKGGYLVNPRDEHEFLNALDKLISDKELRKCFGEFNLKAINKFSLEVVLESMKDLYNKVVKGEI